MQKKICQLNVTFPTKPVMGGLVGVSIGDFLKESVNLLFATCATEHKLYAFYWASERVLGEIAVQVNERLHPRKGGCFVSVTNPVSLMELTKEMPCVHEHIIVAPLGPIEEVPTPVVRRRWLFASDQTSWFLEHLSSFSLVAYLGCPLAGLVIYTHTTQWMPLAEKTLQYIHDSQESTIDSFCVRFL